MTANPDHWGDTPICVMGSDDNRHDWVVVSRRAGSAEQIRQRPDKSRRYSIAYPESPVGNWFEKDQSLSREQQIDAFKEYVMSEWMAKDNAPPAVREWINARVKEVKAGRRIDLVCDCRKTAIPTDKAWIGYEPGCHGELLAEIIYLLAKTSS